MGRDVSPEDVAQWADNGNLYVLHAYGDGVKNKFFCRRSQWIESRQQLIDIDDNFTTESRFAAGLRYVQGEGGSKDTARALRLFEAAAAEGHAGAQHNLGVMYAKGDGVQRDLARAVLYYTQAAVQGNPAAQGALATFYRTGDGVEKDDAVALKWCQLAAENGNAVEQRNLGLLNVRGDGIPQNLLLAHYWWSLAASQGNSDAAQWIGTLEKRMTPEEIADAKQAAREWKPDAPSI